MNTTESTYVPTVENARAMYRVGVTESHTDVIRAEAEAEAMARAKTHPTVQAVLAAFSGARLLSARQIPPPVTENVEILGAASALHDDGAGPVAAAEEWDPFEDEE